MALSQALLPEFENEMANTRKTLERVPENRADWKPHEKSMTLGRLAGHLAEIPGWTAMALERESIDIAPPGAPPPQAAIAHSAKEALELFDQGVSRARASLAAASDESLKQNWSLLAGGKNILTMPRIAVLRSFIMNHMIHHRAQLGVYLRLNNIPVPAIYGPSADEGTM